MNPAPSNQEIFDRVAKHLLQQYERSSDDVSCKYRVNGLSCAIGCLIPDENYTAEIEGRGVFWLSDQGRLDDLLGFKVGEPQLSLLHRLQGIHDGVRVERWAAALRDTARHNKLDGSVVVDLSQVDCDE